PDIDAVAAILSATIERSLDRNFLLVNNALGAIGTDDLARRLEPVLRRCMEADDPVTRERALRAWARTSATPDPAVLAARAADPWARTAFAAMAELERIGGPGAAGALRAVLPRVSPFALGGACNYLGRLGDPESIALLEQEHLKAEAAGPPQAGVRAGALQGLGRLGHEPSLEALRSWVAASPFDAPAVDVEGDRASWDGPEVVLAERRDAALRTRLAAQARRAPPGPAAAAVALLAARYLPDGEAASAARDAFERSDADAVLVAESLAALHAAGAVDARPKALALLQSPAAERRYGAALVLGRWRDASAVKPLAERLAKEPDPAPGRKMCDALGLIGDPAGAPALVAFLASEPNPDPAGSLLAFQAASNLRGAMAAAVAKDLAALVRGGRTRAIRFHAARALGRAAGSPEARPALEALLRDADPALRASAAEALGDLGDAAARDALAQAYAREPDDETARAAWEAILRLDLGSPAP
ncbi:MAG TPA: HEAT repeat domain-containing protein, partial [Planctomycetota bacterium]|nr:HEAT repeat domain-containing protein [Planctomycetota bacterium]